jgi:hypothetical protein
MSFFLFPFECLIRPEYSLCAAAMGRQIGDELDRQSAQIDRIGDSVAVNIAKTNKVNRKIDDCL